VDVDTNVQHGGKTTAVDTVKKTRGAMEKDTGATR